VNKDEYISTSFLDVDITNYRLRIHNVARYIDSLAWKNLSLTLPIFFDFLRQVERVNVLVYIERCMWQHKIVITIYNQKRTSRMVTSKPMHCFKPYIDIIKYYIFATLSPTVYIDLKNVGF